MNVLSVDLHQFKEQYMSNSRHYKPKLLKIQTEITTYYCYSCSLVHGPSEREEEGRSSTHCMCMHRIFRIFYRKNVRKSIQTVHRRTWILQNLENDDACACSEYEAFLSPPPQKAWG